MLEALWETAYAPAHGDMFTGRANYYVYALWVDGVVTGSGTDM